MRAQVELARVLALCDPRAWPWSCPAPTPSRLAELLCSAEEVPTPVACEATAEQHVGRIIFLAKQGWSDPVELDVGVPCLGYGGPSWPVTDGNHRLWAAVLRRDEMIDVLVAGQLDHAARLLGLAEDEWDK